MRNQRQNRTSKTDSHTAVTAQSKGGRPAKVPKFKAAAIEALDQINLYAARIDVGSSAELRLRTAQNGEVGPIQCAFFRMAALAAGQTYTWIGRFYRRKKAHLGAPKAITATAHKIACIVYHMLKYQEEFLPLDVALYELKSQETHAKLAKTGLGARLRTN